MGVVSAMAADAEDQNRLRGLGEECSAHVDALSNAQIAHLQTHENFVYSPEYVPDSQPGPELRDWPEGTRFDTLGWSPSAGVRGAYRVIERSPNDFMITCITDVDGDGQRASWTATRYLNVVRTTPDDVF